MLFRVGISPLCIASMSCTPSTSCISSCAWEFSYSWSYSIIGRIILSPEEGFFKLMLVSKRDMEGWMTNEAEDCVVDPEHGVQGSVFEGISPECSEGEEGMIIFDPEKV